MAKMKILGSIANISTKRPKSALIIVGIIFISFSVLALRIRLDVDLNNMVHKGDPSFSYVFDSLQRFGGVDRAFIAIENTNKIDPESHRIPEKRSK